MLYFRTEGIVMEQNSLENYQWKGDLLRIRTYPDPVLKKVAQPVETFDEELEKLCFDMLYTMYEARGIGLAAPQVGVSKKIFVIDIDYDRTKEQDEEGNLHYVPRGFRPMILINPTIENLEGEIVFREGCLSLPKVYDDVTRYRTCTVHYQNIKGQECILEASDLLSICVQHENDHLNGVVFLERLSQLKRDIYIKKLIKRQKRMEATQGA